tara:strand:+ start:263 stop:1012 length:750 start_codon:yes stop_codon:yes gene_type:complete
MDKKDLSDKKVVLITGAGSGIGLAVTEKFLKNNIFVESCTRNNLKELNSLKNNNHNFQKYLSINKFNLNNYDDLKLHITNIYKKHKKIDALVNCAGIPHGGLCNITKIDKIKEVFETNFFSQISIIQLVSRLMSRNKKGAIVNVSSVTSFQYESGTLAYGSSKSALNYATKILAKELGTFGIKVNAVAPGITKTPMLEKMNPESIKKQISLSSNNKIAEPKDVASLIYFLCSEESNHITGQIIKIDGGQ